LSKSVLHFVHLNLSKIALEASNIHVRARDRRGLSRIEYFDFGRNGLANFDVEVGHLYEYGRAFSQEKDSRLLLRPIGGISGGLSSVFGSPPQAESNGGIDGKRERNNYFYAKSFLIASLGSLLSGFPLFGWGWSFLYYDPKGDRDRGRRKLAGLSCVGGVILWMVGTVGIMAWSTQF
jgi:hypothetical protein